MSFEGFVRPFVAPPIRPPAKPPVLPFQDTPEQGVAVLRGLGGKLIDLTFSETSSWSKSVNVEVERTVAVERVYQKKPPTPEQPKGEIEKENYVDVERVQKMTTRDGSGVETQYKYAEPEPQPNVEILEDGKVKKNGTISPAVDDDERLPNIG
jgi:hypothetical protein